MLKGIIIDQEVKKATGFVFGRMLTISTPDIVCDCIAFIKLGMKTEGIFRIPGNRSNVERIQASYDSNEKDILNTAVDIDIHDVCSTLKAYFNALPEPLMSYAAYEELEEGFDSENGINNEQVITIVRKIQKPQIGVLGMLLNFLYDIKKESK